MDTAYLMEKIGLPAAGRRVVCTSALSPAEYTAWKALFYGDEAAFFARLALRPGRERLTLILYVNFAAELYPCFQAAGIADEVYFATFLDLSIWYRRCVAEKNCPGLAEARWLALSLKMKLFRLGRLQFEPEGDRLHVHIPEGGPLLPALCSDAFARADRFFDGTYREYDCLSWLLSPRLRELLNGKSNILRFQSRFQVQPQEDTICDGERRIFGAVLADKRRYPENTGLQRRVKAYLLAGGSLGAGYGTIQRVNR